MDGPDWARRRDALLGHGRLRRWLVAREEREVFTYRACHRRAWRRRAVPRLRAWPPLLRPARDRLARLRVRRARRCYALRRSDGRLPPLAAHRGDGAYRRLSRAGYRRTRQRLPARTRPLSSRPQPWRVLRLTQAPLVRARLPRVYAGRRHVLYLERFPPEQRWTVCGAREPRVPLGRPRALYDWRHRWGEDARQGRQRSCMGGALRQCGRLLRLARRGLSRIVLQQIRGAHTPRTRRRVSCSRDAGDSPRLGRSRHGEHSSRVRARLPRDCATPSFRPSVVHRLVGGACRRRFRGRGAQRRAHTWRPLLSAPHCRRCGRALLLRAACLLRTSGLQADRADGRRVFQGIRLAARPPLVASRCGGAYCAAC